MPEKTPGEPNLPSRIYHLEKTSIIMLVIPVFGESKKNIEIRKIRSGK
jgi:hypothetical protein